MAHIFISYSKQDIVFARHLRRLLEDQGFGVWMDETQIVPSDLWWPTIEANIKTCGAFIVIMSPRSRPSVWVEREILYAERLKKPVFPILLEGEIWPRLANIQAQDMTAGMGAPLPNSLVRGLAVTVARGRQPVVPPQLPGELIEETPVVPLEAQKRAATIALVSILAILFVLIGLALVLDLIGGDQPGGDIDNTPTSSRTSTVTLTQSPEPTSTVTLSPTSDTASVTEFWDGMTQTVRALDAAHATQTQQAAAVVAQASPTPSLTSTASLTPTVSLTPTLTPTPGPSHTPRPTNTPRRTPTFTPTPTLIPAGSTGDAWQPVLNVVERKTEGETRKVTILLPGLLCLLALGLMIWSGVVLWIYFGRDSYRRYAYNDELSSGIALLVVGVALGAVSYFCVFSGFLPTKLFGRVDIKSVKAEFARVPAGCFEMGSADGVADEQPVHPVCLSAFWIGRTEVTNAQYAICVEDKACKPPANRIFYNNPAYANHPVVYLTWSDAAAYAQWLGGSLPTEAQWEYAARGPASNKYPWGDQEPRCQHANFNACTYEQNTDQVASDQRLDGASWVGAVDMAGNVWEWVTDWYDEAYYNTMDSRRTNPVGPRFPDERATHVLRGGAWNSSSSEIRAAARYPQPLPMTSINQAWGFRVVLPDPLP